MFAHVIMLAGSRLSRSAPECVLGYQGEGESMEACYLRVLATISQAQKGGYMPSIHLLFPEQVTPELLEEFKRLEASLDRPPKIAADPEQRGFMSLFSSEEFEEILASIDA